MSSTLNGRELSAEFYMNSLIAVLLAALIGIGTVGLWALQQGHLRSEAALRSGHELGLAAGLVRAADASARGLAQAAEALRGQPAAEAQVAALQRQHEALQRQWREAAALIARNGLDASPVAQAASQQAQRMAAFEKSLQAGPGATLPSAAWTDVAPAVDKLMEAQQARLEGDVGSRRTRASWIVGTLGVCAIGLALLFRHLIRRSAQRPIRAASRLLERVARGDLTVTAAGMDQVHTRQLGATIDGLVASWRRIGGDILVGARTVADTSAQIAQGNLDLSQRTEEQASTLEETASSMEELTSTVAHNADNARQASQLAVNASEVARKGGQVVGQVVTTMTDISASSRRIGDIIGVIDGIAFQTNILALNAAVEAARAGEQGRGFAVVAAEVRSLAQRSAAAAKEIKGLIGDSVGKVEAGTRLVDDAGKTMAEIVTSVKKVSDLIAEIAAASQEQSAGIGQVNTAVAQMEQVVQQNASLVEQATAATEAMKDQAAHMLSLVAGLKLDAGPAPAEITPVRPMAVRPAAVPPPAPPKPQRPARAALPPTYAAAIPAGAATPRGRGGDWEEF